MPKARNLARLTVDSNGDVDASALDAVTPALISDKSNTSTGSFDLPVGTTAQRPESPQSGMVRMNSTTGTPEWYDSINNIWVAFSDGTAYSVEMFAWGGGGGGGYNAGAGGGGGAAAGTMTVTPFTSFAVVVGGGGDTRAANAGQGSAAPGGGGLCGSLGYGGNGGGYSGIFLTSASQANARLIAGGGGGAAYEGAAGGAGGGTNGVAGGSGNEAGGGGGTQSAGGSSVSQTGSALQGGTVGGHADQGGWRRRIWIFQSCFCHIGHIERRIWNDSRRLIK